LPLIVKVLLFRTVYAVALLLFFSHPQCGHVSKKQTHTIRKHFVYVIADTSDKLPVLPPLPRDTSYLESIFSKYKLVNIAELDSSILVHLKYADPNNILQTDFYDGLRNAYFTCPLALRLCNAQYFLNQIDSSLSLMVLDAARPLHIQKMMWDSVNIRTDIKNSYLAPPEATSLHNYGCAVDVTIADAKSGQMLDMGTDYDYFSRLSRPDCEKEFLKSGLLTAEAQRNRRLLRWVMKRAGLKGITSEWWHFSLYTREEAASKFPLIQ
jgi:zinc D-Ala-D-Ala dipeptidase